MSATAGPPQIAYKTAASPDGKVIRLEPVMDLEVIVPHEDKEDVTSNLLARRASIARVEFRGGMQIITARVPLADMFGYATDLRERTLGRGTYMMKPAGYQALKQTDGGDGAESQPSPR